MSTTIESLELEIVSNSTSAVSGIESLSQSLEKLKTATKGGMGLNAVAKQIRSISDATNGMQAGSIAKLNSLSHAIKLLSGVKVSSTLGTNIASISAALNGLKIENAGNVMKIQDLVTALMPLSQMPQQNISGFITQLKKIPDVLNGLNSIDMDEFRDKIQEVADAMKPLADEMNKVAAGFAAFPAQIQKYMNSVGRVPNANNNTTMSFTELYHIIKMVWGVIKKAAQEIWESLENSSDYIENVNLFSVAMGEYAQAAKGYAEQVSEVMGIDPGEWMRNQGLFQTLVTGFGVASDSANEMSTQLTQLAYDLSSFYNIDVETAMQKLKSGMAGELEPLRAIGYDLSQAKLEATAAELGIDKAVSSMTQAEKSMLRYHAIMTQVTETHGDMARTLDEPANQIRILKAQVEMLSREIGNVFMPLLRDILPFGIAVVKVLREVVSIIATLVGYEPPDLKNTGVDSLASGSEDTATALENASDEAKKLKSYMMGFDELNVISPNEGGTDESLGSFDMELPDYGANFMGDEVGAKAAAIVEKLREWLGLTKDIDSWWDLLDTKFGNILVTIGLIGVGLATWTIATGVLLVINNMDKLLLILQSFKTAGLIALKTVGVAAVAAVAVASAKWLIDHTEDTITKIGAIISAAFLVVGAILAFFGINIPLGIGLMAMGAVAMGTAIAMNTEALSEEVKGVIGVITGAVSVALLAVGAILAFSGINVPLGIALLAGGALTLATTVVPNWSTIETALEGPVGAVTAIVSGALLVVGAILAFSGINIPLGIAMLGVGAAGLATVAAVNWECIVDAMQGPVGKIMAIAGAAALVIGLILLFTGVGIPLGLGLILGGAAALGTAIAFNWDSIVDAVKGVWKKITKFWDDNIAPVFTAKWWKDLGITVVNGLIDGFEAGINGIIWAFESMINWIVKGINKISFDVPDWVPGIGGKKFGFNIPMASFGRVSIPRFEDGGFPATGQMFIANEAGPELVGTIGRRTAVANNEQIVESISVGVAEANSEQNMLLREQNSLLRALLEKDSGVYLDGRSLSDSVDKYKREQGRVLITGGAL